MKKNSFSAFTLVELIVVITIVGILSTIGFVSYSNYLSGARDSNRISQMVKLSDALQVYAATKSLPLPDDKIDIMANGELIAYQGHLGQQVLETIDFTNGGLDPKDDAPYSYYVTKNRKKMQLLAFMEENSTNVAFLNETYATDYENRYPKVYGNKLGILIQKDTNIPLQDISSIVGSFDHFTNTTLTLTAIFSDNEKFSSTGSTLYSLSSTRLGEKAPTDCPDGFVGVPGNPEFQTNGFCVAQYEMSYSDILTPNSTGGGTNYNSVSYVPNKKISSMAGRYPIGDITQQEAIAACTSLGTSYHLITNNEWMTIARNIESTPANWSTSQVGVGNLWNGVSGDLSFGCDSKGGNGTSDPRAFVTKTGPGTGSGALTCNIRRNDILSNGGEIWDFSGNMLEHVNKSNTLDGQGYNVGQTSVSGASPTTGHEADGIYAVNDMRKFGSAYMFGRTNGFGTVAEAQGVSSNIILRGGEASGVGGAGATGIYSLTLLYTATHEDRGTGFRCTKSF